MALSSRILKLRSRVIGLKRDLDAEARAYRHRKAQRWLGGLARAQDQSLSHASTQGQLRGLAGALAEEASDISHVLAGRPYGIDEYNIDHPVGFYLERAEENLREIAGLDSEEYLLGSGPEYATRAVEELAAIQVDASGVDLSDLNLHELGAARGVIYTEYTRWPSSIADAVHARRRDIRPGIFQMP